MRPEYVEAVDAVSSRPNWLMRPEYVEAVDAVSWGWSFWIIFLLPGAVILWGALVARGRPSFGWISILLGFVLCHSLIVFHALYLYEMKGLLAETDAELWQAHDNDLGVLFAPMTALFLSVPLWILLTVGAYVVAGVVRRIERKRRRLGKPPLIPSVDLFTPLRWCIARLRGIDWLRAYDVSRRTAISAYYVSRSAYGTARSISVELRPWASLLFEAATMGLASMFYGVVVTLPLLYLGGVRPLPIVELGGTLFCLGAMFQVGIYSRAALAKSPR